MNEKENPLHSTFLTPIPVKEQVRLLVALAEKKVVSLQQFVLVSLDSGDSFVSTLESRNIRRWKR